MGIQRKVSRIVIRASLGLVASALMPVAQAARFDDRASHRIENDEGAVTFQRRGDGLALVSIQRLPEGSPISLEPYSGDWRINLKTRNHPNEELSLAMSRKTEAKAARTDGVMQAGGHVFEAHWSEQEDRDVVESPHAKGSVRLKNIDAQKQSIAGVWEGDATIFDEACRFEVTTRWTLKPGDFALHTSIEVHVVPADGKDRSPIYLSSVDYPIYRIQPLGLDDYIAVPWIGGHLYHHPVKHKMRVYGNEPGAISMPLYAYYDKGTDDCLYICNTDVRGNYKIIETRTAEGYLLHRVRQIPPDVFDSRLYQQPYDDVLGALKGDWITAAETYRSFLAEHADWYKGPVGADTNPMPKRVKDCMMVATHQWGPHGSTLKDYTHDDFFKMLPSNPWVRDPWETTVDAMGEDHTLVSDRVKGAVFSTWYGGHYEGSIQGEQPLENGRSCCLYCDDHEDVAKALNRAITIAQEGTENIVAPYVNAQSGYLFTANPNDKGPYTSRNYGALASALVMEGGTPRMKRQDKITCLCPAAPWWREHLPEVVRDHYRRWGIRGIYLDYFMNFHTCYSELHDHKPGGGDFMIQNKVHQMRRIRELLAKEGMNDFAIAMESVCGPYTAEANLSYRHMFSNWATTEYSEAIPYFEWVFDNIKYYRVTSHGSITGAQQTGIWSWYVANEVFLFDLVPSAGNGLVNYHKFFGNPSGEPYYAFLAKLVNFLSSDGFKKYHNGSLARVPEGEVTPEGNFHVRVTFPISENINPGEVYYDRSSSGNREYAKPYILSVLPRGMFKSPNGNLAFVICNPWVGPNPFSKAERFAYKFTFDPGQYAGFPARYRLTAIGPGGSRRDLGIKSGRCPIRGELRPGEIAYWTIERLEQQK